MVSINNGLSHGKKKQMCPGGSIDVLFVENLDHWPRLNIGGRRTVSLLHTVLSSYLAVCIWPSAQGHSPLWGYWSLACRRQHAQVNWANCVHWLLLKWVWKKLCSTRLLLCSNVFISLSRGPCTFGVREGEAFHNSYFLTFICISSLQFLDF